MSGVIPMTSARIGDGVYEVLGTSRNCVVQRAYRGAKFSTFGEPVADGWNLIVDGEWAQWYPTKRAALQACQENPEL